MSMPVPTLDHVVVNCRDRLDEGLAVYRRLGFQMTPRGYHSLGSMNHLAIFGTDYLELIAVPSADTPRRDVMQYPIGLNGLVFGTEDSAATYAAAIGAGVPVEPPMEFSRPVALAEGEQPARDAVFRTIHLSPGTVTAGRFYFCHHFTRDLVWRDAWRTHPNGAIGIAGATIAAADPTALAAISPACSAPTRSARSKAGTAWPSASPRSIRHPGRGRRPLRRRGAQCRRARSIHGRRRHPHPLARHGGACPWSLREAPDEPPDCASVGGDGATLVFHE